MQLPIETQHPGTKDLLSAAWSFPVLFSSEVLQRDTFDFFHAIKALVTEQTAPYRKAVWGS